jgi:hypothetical protein
MGGRLVEVEDFRLSGQRHDERRLAKAAIGAAPPAFTKVWDNPDDAAYDRL